MIEKFVEKVKGVFSEDSLVREDPQMLKGMVDELHSELEGVHIHYADVMTELNDKLEKIKKAIDSDPKDVDSLIKSKERVTQRIEEFELEHLNDVSSKVETLSKAEARFDIISKSEYTNHPFARFNYDGDNPFEGEEITPARVSDFVKSLSPEFLRKVYVDDRIDSVDAIDETDFLYAIKSLQKGIESKILSDSYIEKARKNISNLVPVRRRAQRKDGTSYMTTVYIKRDEAKKLSKKEKGKIIERAEAKKAQKESEKFVRPGDDAVVRWVGSGTGTEYESANLMVKEINPDSVVFEFKDIFWTQNPDANFYAYKRGALLEIPRTHINTWKKNLSFELTGVDFEARKKEAKYGISEDKIRQLSEKGFRISAPHLREQSIRNFNHHFKAFNFERFFSKIEEEYVDTFGDEAKASNRGSYVAKINSDGTFDFSANVPGRVAMSRTVNFYQGNRKKVYHAYFKVMKVSDRGSGLGKKALHALYNEYKEAGIDRLTVSPAWVGKYTWGRLGFYTSQGGARSILGSFRNRVGETIMVKPNYVGISDDREWKVEDNKIMIKEGDDWVDVSKEKTTVAEGSRDLENNSVISGEVNRYKHNPAEDALMDYSKSEFYELTEQDYDKAKNVFDSFYKNNNSNVSFPVRLFCDINKSKAGKAAMLYGAGWDGHLDLSNDEQRKAFEKAIGYNKK